MNAGALIGIVIFSAQAEHRRVPASEGGMIVHRENVIKVLADTLGVPEGSLLDSSSFVEDLACDSLDSIEAVISLEDAFDIVITDEEAEKVRTVGQAVAVVIEKAKANELAD